MGLESGLTANRRELVSRAALAVERCEKELAEVRKDGDEFEKLDEIKAAAAAERFEAVTMELKRLSKNKF